jgi:hypothetical protein
MIWRCSAAARDAPWLVRFTQYFIENVALRRPYIRREWLERAIQSADWVEPQDDGRIRYWLYIPELERYLRVVTLEDGVTVHNAFPDRRFRRPDR